MQQPLTHALMEGPAAAAGSVTQRASSGPPARVAAEGSASNNQLDGCEQLSAAQVAMEALDAQVMMEALAVDSKIRVEIKHLESGLESEVQTLHEGGSVRGCSKAGPPCTSQEDGAAPLGLLSQLSGDILEVVVSKVQGKSSLLSTCRSLRQAVHACTSALSWAGLGGEELGPLAAFTSLRTLNCGWSRVADLEPLAACMSLQTLNCSGTRVAVLGPLAACTSLQTLDCRYTKVAELGPLAACMLLKILGCSHTEVDEMGPLAACKLLRTLDCSHTRVSDLGPLAVCTSLEHLSCCGTGVADVGPLVACPLLAGLECPLVPTTSTRCAGSAAQGGML